ncbi:MAG: aminotransferase class I/II-fold pyridoxal phosphate-dependent enzyme, partial [Syntrophobacteraceae bacterium]|nr:aminotransferase class I/II-fold pyridoxal phosphate-dependent enzyme [Syntrophobacteraceae bacterium]
MGSALAAARTVTWSASAATTTLFTIPLKHRANVRACGWSWHDLIDATTVAFPDRTLSYWWQAHPTECRYVRPVFTLVLKAEYALGRGNPVFIDTYPDFTIKEELLRAAITEKTKVILVNSPNNPTGMVHSREELEKILIERETPNVISIEQVLKASEAYTDFYNTQFKILQSNTLAAAV